MSEFEPKILAFVCNWCTYLGADLAGTSRLKYAPNIRVINLPCSGRLEPLFVLKAFERGADGVIISGCHPGDCHYTSGSSIARRRWIIFRRLLHILGIEGRVHFFWVSAAEGRKWAEIVDEVTESIKRLGPFKEFPALENAWAEREKLTASLE